MSWLPDAESFRRFAGGPSAGVLPAVARAGLSTLAAPYGMVVAARNAAYDCGLLPVARARVPVISVGNLTLGGTGKTPLVAWVVRALVTAGRRPAIVSRGYAARRGTVGDEAAELAIILPGVPHAADPDRVAAVELAAGQGDCAVLDDGFQHRRLGRDLDIVAVDATDPFGCGRLFPRGLLREPLSGLARAHAVVLTRAGAVDAARRAEIRTALDRACGGRLPAAWVEAEHRPVSIRTATGVVEPLASLVGRRVVAYAGIGNPVAFRDTLVTAGAEVAAFLRFADHHAYTAADFRRIAADATATGATTIVTTLKDLVKMPHERLGGVPVVALEIALGLSAGAETLERLVFAAAACGGPASARS